MKSRAATHAGPTKAVDGGPGMGDKPGTTDQAGWSKVVQALAVWNFCLLYLTPALPNVPAAAVPTFVNKNNRKQTRFFLLYFFFFFFFFFFFWKKEGRDRQEQKWKNYEVDGQLFLGYHYMLPSASRPSAKWSLNGNNYLWAHAPPLNCRRGRKDKIWKQNPILSAFLVIVY